MMDKGFETEVIERLTRIETKLDDYDSIRDKAEDAYARSKNNEKTIEEIKDNNKWLRRAVIGAFITSRSWLVIFNCKNRRKKLYI